MLTVRRLEKFVLHTGNLPVFILQALRVCSTICGRRLASRPTIINHIRELSGKQAAKILWLPIAVPTRGWLLLHCCGGHLNFRGRNVQPLQGLISLPTWPMPSENYYRKG